ncbi:MAG: cupin domain-containing protein [Sedimentibacter sp.]|uniref:cupin domain-containing protein n=1 Tax=Sedimentibacter sp. TaxID=1960295 RepID=UPI0031599075
MYNNYPNPYYMNTPWYNPYAMYGPCNSYPPPYGAGSSGRYYSNQDKSRRLIGALVHDTTQNMQVQIKDYGPEPFTVNINEITKDNSNFRTALWTGDGLQLTLMSINPGDEIGLEMHPDLDQFIRIEEGEGMVMMGDIQDNLDYREEVYDDFAFIIPAGKWHNLVNTGRIPIKLYSIYAPPQHPHGTVHRTRAEAEAAEEHQ